MADFGPPIHPPTDEPAAEYIEGVRARLNGQQATTNPYDSDKQNSQYLDWNHGYWWAAHRSEAAQQFMAGR